MDATNAGKVNLGGDNNTTAKNSVGGNVKADGDGSQVDFNGDSNKVGKDGTPANVEATKDGKVNLNAAGTDGNTLNANVGTASGGDINVDAKAGANKVTGDVTADGKGNDNVDSSVNLTGEKGNTVGGKVEATKDGDVNIASANGDNTVTGPVTANTSGDIKVETPNGKNLFNGVVTSTDDGSTIKVDAKENEFTKDVTADNKGDINIGATGDNGNKFGANVTADKEGKINVTADKGSNAFGGDVSTDNGGTITGTATEGKNTVTGNVDATGKGSAPDNKKSSVDLNAKENNVAGNVKADDTGTVNLAGKDANTVGGNVDATNAGKVNLGGDSNTTAKNSVGGDVKADGEGSQVDFNGATNKVGTTDKPANLTADNKGKINLNSSDSSDITGNIKADNAGEISLENGNGDNITGNLTSDNEGKVRVRKARSLTGDVTSDHDGTVDIEFTDNGTLTGDVTTDNGGTANINFGKDGTFDGSANNNKDGKGSKGSINLNIGEGGAWNVKPGSKNSIDNLSGTGDVNAGGNPKVKTEITIDKLVNPKDNPATHGKGTGETDIRFVVDIDPANPSENSDVININSKNPDVKKQDLEIANSGKAFESLKAGDTINLGKVPKDTFDVVTKTASGTVLDSHFSVVVNENGELVLVRNASAAETDLAKGLSSLAASSFGRITRTLINDSLFKRLEDVDYKTPSLGTWVRYRHNNEGKRGSYKSSGNTTQVGFDKAVQHGDWTSRNGVSFEFGD